MFGFDSSHILLVFGGWPFYVLLTPPVPGHATRLVHIQHQDHEQHHCAANRVDQCVPQCAEIVIGCSRICCYVCEVADRLRFHQQDDGGDYGQQERDQDPIVPEQAPVGPK